MSIVTRSIRAVDFLKVLVIFIIILLSLYAIIKKPQNTRDHYPKLCDTRYFGSEVPFCFSISPDPRFVNIFFTELIFFNKSINLMFNIFYVKLLTKLKFKI